MKKQILILGISTICLVLGIIFSKVFNDIGEAIGVMMICVAILFGFGLMGFLEEVRHKYHKPKKLSVARIQNKTIVVVDGDLFEYDSAEWFNYTKDDFKKLMVDKHYNSYAFCCHTGLKIMSDKDIKKALAE